MWRVAAGLILFGISFGYVEASVVVYLRTVYDPVRHRLHPNRASGELFPLIRVDQLKSEAAEQSWLLGVEVAREAATIVMLAAVALVAGRALWLPAFAIVFGTWDLFFYLFLKVLLHWPASVMTWDILFLIPVPWAAPVLAPSLVSVTIIGTGLLALSRPVRMRPAHWIAMTLGGVLILMSFMWDYRNLLAGGLPRPFAWGVFGAGEAAGVTAFFHAFRARSPRPYESCETSV
ncbi:MAG TPA: hypothetical protein VK752_32585 [Bryobacteraceae bacterium]|jgi:hypothetical protein|nr:hypothetical protein [Bryobacteraceae bacterium]